MWKGHLWEKKTLNILIDEKKILNKDLIARTKLLPIKKMATPKDIANYIYHLSSNENQFITNEIINITGGE